MCGARRRRPHPLRRRRPSPWSAPVRPSTADRPSWVGGERPEVDDAVGTPTTIHWLVSAVVAAGCGGGAGSVWVRRRPAPRAGGSAAPVRRHATPVVTAFFSGIGKFTSTPDRRRHRPLAAGSSQRGGSSPNCRRNRFGTESATNRDLGESTCGRSSRRRSEQLTLGVDDAGRSSGGASS